MGTTVAPSAPTRKLPQSAASSPSFVSQSCTAAARGRREARRPRAPSASCRRRRSRRARARRSRRPAPVIAITRVGARPAAVGDEEPDRERDRRRRCGERERARPVVGAGSAGRPSAAVPPQSRRQLGRRAGLRRARRGRAASRARSVGVELRADELVEVGAAVVHSSSPVELVREPRERASRSRLHRPEGYTERVGDLALREAAPVRELDHRPLVLGKDLEGAVYAATPATRPPRGPAGPGRRRGSSGSSAAGSGVRRRPSMIALRATA